MDLPPAAPTPPVNNGGMASTNADRTANLLNLLKFSGTSASSASQQQQQQHHGQKQGQQPPDHQHHQQQHSSRHSSYSQNHYSSPPTRIHQPAPAGADPTGLLAALMRGAAHDAEDARQTPPVPQQSRPQPAEPSPFGKGSPSANTTSYLLNLLNRPKPSQTDQLSSPATSRANGAVSQSPDTTTTDTHRFFHQYQPQPQLPTSAYHPQSLHFQQHGGSESSPIEAPSQAVAGHQYPYAQTQGKESPADMSALYQQLMGSLAPQPSYSSQSAGHGPVQPVQILKKDQPSPAASSHNQEQQQQPPPPPPAVSGRSSDASPLPDRVDDAANRASSAHSHQSMTKQTPSAELDGFVSVDKAGKEPVAAAAAVDDVVVEQVDDKEARDALERAGHDFAVVEAVDNNKAGGSPGPEWPRQGTAAAASVVGAIEQQIVQNIRDGHAIAASRDTPEALGVGDASDSGNAAGHVNPAQDVADSWESADQEEVVVIEEKEPPPVRVYNFPMKPWISISLQEDVNHARPEFRDESIMDIARLRKDFDQMDRNLYTASQNYMTYGMSKQGGLRVIRQEDGKDAKVFTDTKDRIFNVAMSVTPWEHSVEREAIIGTGISGTVYWVQIKDGDKDLIEDPHLEQYGFALPPISSHDGDSPGGVLKTRARASTIHPEFFAVGRGKSINFIWPSYILQNKLFKAGHDRVVDTEALLKQSSLRISTGKAGKDFTFSQDDTVVVSLDKSGRVKFWDVRELAAAKEGSDPRCPLPAHSSLEIKDPLMTLATTPDGEKAWPTSVLLLDKQRPYQRRGALRYMIVGMKQNHTLQLWDLALGKPVQEFNLPHSKESDAVCSVMYHPASGIIVIGHPTRNSVYFAHLSAPKYNLKNVSQADYIQRVLSQDSSIPQPSSTAVISGVREYSFANRGVLRSLDILCESNTVQDQREPALFELYAMHSKGVACVLVRQCELGWSKDNKVLDAADAVDQGLATVAKLKMPQQAVELSNGGGGGGDRDQQAAKNASARSAVKEVVRRDTTPSAQTQAGDGTQSAAAADSAVVPAASATGIIATGSPAITLLLAPSAATQVKPRNEAKEAETVPLQSSSSSKEGPAEKPERKSRKKKGNAGKEIGEGVSSGGGGGNNANGPRAVAQSGKAESNARIANGVVTAESFESAVSTMQARLTAAISETLKSSLDSLQGKIDQGARLRDENFNQHQIKLLDMVSEVLNENTQKVLEALIHHQFTELVIPAIGDKATKAVSDVLQNKLQPHISSAVQKEIQSSLPQALGRCLRSGDLVTAVAERVGKSVHATLQQEVAATLTQRLTPAFRNLANQSAQQAVGEVHQQYRDELEQMRSRRAADSNKIDQLLSYVTRLTDMVSTMATSQSALQAEFLKLKQQPVHELPGAPGVQQAAAAATPSMEGGHGSRGYGPHAYSNSNGNSGMVVGSNAQPSVAGSYQSSHVASQRHHHHHHHHQQQQQQQQQQYLASSEYMRGGGQQLSSPRDSAPPTDISGASKMGGVAGAFASQVSKTDAESEHEIQRRVLVMEQAIKEGRLQDAIIQWIQSGHEKEIFHRCLSLQHPSRFENLPPLVLLVVIATIAKDLRVSPRLKQEIDWIQMAIESFGATMPNSDWEQQGYREMMGTVSQTMQLLIGRLNSLMAGYDSSYPIDPWLASVDRGKIEWVVQSAQHIIQTTFGGAQDYE